MKAVFALLGIAAPIAAASAQDFERVPAAPFPARLLPMHVVGRVDASGQGYVRQWPGSYFEAAFRGTDAFIRVGPGEVSLRVRIDQGAPIALVRPAPGMYRVTGLTAGSHRIRVDVASESQAESTGFVGILTRRGNALPAPAPRRRQIEFIGDSHTVGYGNTSTVRDCAQDQVWLTTDTTRGLAPLTAAKYDADYQVNAISGRGIVRNYAGGPGDTLPQAYPFTLFDKAATYEDRAWKPQVIVVALGTNDFSTPLKPDEPWKTREQLHGDYEASYVAFVRRIRTAHPRALILLWSTDLHEGEIASEVGKVVAAVNADGDRRVSAVKIGDLAMSGCHSHPSLADDARIADLLAAAIDSRPDAWLARRR